MRGRRIQALLITFDAFETLFHPRRPVPEVYASIAHTFGVSKSQVSAERLHAAFKTAFKIQSKAYPNYGRQQVLSGRYGGPRQWWTELINITFARVLDGNSNGLPSGLVERLLDTFASGEGYTLYDDALPLFTELRKLKNTSRTYEHIVTGVISNSDDRVPAVLKSLGLSVGNVRADRDRSSIDLPGFEQTNKDGQAPSSSGDDDINMVITSYEAGQEKPDSFIYEVAAKQAQQYLCTAVVPGLPSESVEWTRIHVGDDVHKDCIGALDAGWRGVLLARQGTTFDMPENVKKIRSLKEVISVIENT